MMEEGKVRREGGREGEEACVGRFLAGLDRNHHLPRPINQSPLNLLCPHCLVTATYRASLFRHLISSCQHQWTLTFLEPQLQRQRNPVLKSRRCTASSRKITDI